MRQFDVFVWGDEETLKCSKPTFEDPALGWFFGNDLNDNINLSDAEWFVFAHSSITIDRDFLNDLAQAIEGFPMVDAFAPRIARRENKEARADIFLSGYLLHPGQGFSMLDEGASMQFVAASFPALAVYSRRIVQRTGRFDDSLPMVVQFADYSLRMYHAGGKMFSVPYLVANTTYLNPDDFRQDIPETSFILYKSLGFGVALSYALHHPRYITKFLAGYKAFKEKREAATLLSKLKADTLKKITYAKTK